MIELALRNPITWLSSKVRIIVLFERQTRQCTDISLSFGLAFVGTIAMVELMDHFCFVEWQNITYIAGMKQVGVLCHMKQPGYERESPRVLIGFFTPQDRDTLVYGDRDLGVAAGAEDRSGAGVRV